MKAKSTSAERTLLARRAAYLLHSRTDGVQHTASARAAFMARFEREVDPDGVLPEAERARRAAAARKAYFADLALKSIQTRRAKAKVEAEAKERRANREKGR